MFNRPKTGGRTLRARSQVGCAMSVLLWVFSISLLISTTLAYRMLKLFYKHRKPHDIIKISLPRLLTVEIRRDLPADTQRDPQLKQLERGIMVEPKAIEAVDPPSPKRKRRPPRSTG